MGKNKAAATNMAHLPPAAFVPSSQPVSFDALKAWIFDQEEYMRRTGQPPLLTGAQRHAMGILVQQPHNMALRPIQPPPPPKSVPVLPAQTPTAKPKSTYQPGKSTVKCTEKDTVSMLSRYLQATRAGAPDYKIEQLMYGNALYWRCQCQLPNDAPDLWFPPSESFAEQRPYINIFPTKMQAKQFASRKAIEWLVEEGRMTPNGKHIQRAVELPVGTSSSKTAVVRSLSYMVKEEAEADSIEEGEIREVPQWTGDVTMRDRSPSPLVDMSVNVNNGTIDSRLAGRRVQSMASYAGRGAVAGAANTRSSSWNLVMAAADNGITATNGRGTPGANGNSNGNGNGAGRHSPPFRSDGNDYEVSNIQMLDSLCKVLKLGSPQYELVPSREGAEGIFNGHIVFQPPNAKGGGPGRVPVLPAGIGEVQNAFTKKAAREKIAQSVLHYLNQNMWSSVGAT